MSEIEEPTSSPLLYIVDDDDAIRAVLVNYLTDEGFRVLEGDSGREVLNVVKRESPDLLLMDLRMPDQDGMATLEAVRGYSPEIPVLMMTAYNSSSAAIQAIQQGAYDYITKPFDLEDLLHTVRRALEHRELTRRVREMDRPADYEMRGKFIGQTPPMQEIFKTIGRVAGSDATVMIYGESGTGKEMAANALHAYSPRRSGPFVKVSCASFVETLLESELFGHEKGAFTHAIAQRKGRFEMAHKGSIFLDEIGEMSPNTQKKLLRVLQEREFERVGGSLTIKVDVRVIAATNRDLMREVMEGRFREDLYYRLNVISVTMPPLRDRRDDIPLLVEYFLQKHRLDEKGGPARISEEAMSILMNNSWPGNVRELENTIERAVVLSRGDVITSQHLSVGPSGNTAQLDIVQRVAAGVPLRHLLDEVERAALEEALRQCSPSHLRAAERLGLSSDEFTEKLRLHGLLESAPGGEILASS